MAPRIAVVTILVVVSLVFAGHVKGERQLGGSNVEGSPERVAVGGGASPLSECHEKRLYKGPCLEVFCTVGCLLLQMRQGGHCRGSVLKGRCYCFACS
ncbi:hypothetical protein HU200_054789 [Digitaria exilis]|uniref:Uncharacterized protein n=1 Tax=Digitaria exilis TaxID=1010633 RepID=A0A835APN2_9POAL|nr:hypothetical protein HU200_054789 [Digitaria exilis]CAB3458425.1 unnamed protein product [Digitaria exilis]